MRRWRWWIALALVIALALGALGRRTRGRRVPAPDAAVGSQPPAPTAGTGTGAVAGSPSAPSPADPAVQRAAVEAYASASGTTRIECPTPSRSSHSYVLPGRCATEVTGAVICATREPSGTIAIQSAEATGPDEFALGWSDRPSALLRWWTDPNGQTHCVEQLPTAHTVRAVVVDVAGNPVEGAALAATSLGSVSAPTDATGATELTVWSDAPTELIAASEFDVSAPVLVDPDGPPVTIPLETRGLTEQEFTAFHERDLAAREAEERADLAAALATGPGPEVAAVLRGWDAELAARAAARAAGPAAPPDGDDTAADR
ncbi:MAG: hypothetical protein ABMB14_16205 [Myxococcota bacterium]